MRNPELVSYSLKVILTSHTLGNLKYFPFCDSASRNWPVTWDCWFEGPEYLKCSPVLDTSPDSSPANISPGASVSNWLETDREDPPHKKKQNGGSQPITSFFSRNPKDWKVTQSGNLGSIRGLRQKKKQPRWFVDQTDEEEDMDENENEVGDDPDEPKKDVNFGRDSDGFGMRVE